MQPAYKQSKTEEQEFLGYCFVVNDPNTQLFSKEYLKFEFFTTSVCKYLTLQLAQLSAHTFLLLKTFPTTTQYKQGTAGVRAGGVLSLMSSY